MYYKNISRRRTLKLLAVGVAIGSAAVSEKNLHVQAAEKIPQLPQRIASLLDNQDHWRYCQKCQSMFFDGYPSRGTCAAGGGHDAQGYNFVLPHDLAETPTAQGAWRYCQKCQSMFFDGYPSRGTCAAGGGHDAQGYNFVLPHDLPTSLDFDFNPIVFGGGVPVGGNSHLTIRQDGSFTFSGHFHDSGATEYNVALAWAIKDSQNMVYTFQHSGHVSGTFESGSRDDDWSVDSQNNNIASHWANIAAGSIHDARANANIDLTNLTNSLIGALGTVLGVIAIV